MLRGASAVAWEGAQALMVESSEAMIREEICFSVQDSTASMVWREVESRHQVFVRIERCLRER